MEAHDDQGWEDVEQKPTPYMPAAKSGDWGTPLWLFAMLDEEFEFTLDAAASATNALCEKFYTKEQDALAQSWEGESVFINPPFFAKDLNAFVRKAYVESRARNTIVVMIVPAKTDQRWWHEYAIRTQVAFVKGRVTFAGALHAFPKPVVVLVFGRHIGPSMTTIIIPPKRERGD